MNYDTRNRQPLPSFVEAFACLFGGRTDAWGIPIPDGWDAGDPMFQRRLDECGCYRSGVLRCGVPCIWAWAPGAKIDDRASEMTRAIGEGGGS